MCRPRLRRIAVDAALAGVLAGLLAPAVEPGAGRAVAIEDRGFGRRSELVETTVFFCCAEALHNATKHAGASTSASVLLSHSDGWVRFSVEDDGAGFAPETVARGHGLKNMDDRVAAAGGSVTLDSALGRGARCCGRLPVNG